ncbi:MAG: hypothetical protein AABX04_04520, partial [Nanoarchaeota archaeon]
MLELAVPQVNEESKNVKDLVFTILMNEHPLSMMELFNQIKKQYVLGITYQAVRKSVNYLHQQKVLIKTGKRYSLSKEWLLQMKSFFDRALTNYESGTKVKLFQSELAKEDYAVYTFNNLLDLDNFWGDIMSYWAEHEKENKNYLSVVHYHWWLVINLGKETGLFDLFKKKGVKSAFFTPVDVPLNHWALEVYKGMGVKTILCKQKTEDDFVDINVLGEMVIQVKYAPKMVLRLNKMVLQMITITM